MSTSVLPQLLEVDSELSAQASTLEAQLNQLREKRKGIQTVIAMFESGNSPEIAETITAVASEPVKEAAKAPAKASTEAPSATKTATKRKTKATRAKTAKAETTKAETAKVKAKRGRPARAKAVANSAEAEPIAESTAESTAKATAKQSGRAANWHRYVQETYRKAPLPDVIVGVLQAQPSNVFKIADVMNAVFKEDMPKSHFLKARNRVSNILSAGARSGEWYRGRGGTYSVSEKAVERVG